MSLEATLLARRGAWRPRLRVEALALLAGVLFTLSCNGLFWRAVLAGRDATAAADWLFAGALFVAVTALHFALFCLLLNRWTAKPLLALLIVVTAVAVHYMNRFGLYLDPDMLRNVLSTDTKEAAELFTWGLLPPMLLSVPPLLLLWRLRIEPAPLRRLLWRRPLAALLGLAVCAGALLLVSQDFFPLMRNHKEIRYLITPANYLYSALRVLGTEAKAADGPRAPVGTDATLSAAWRGRDRPVMLVIVVGETARAANWGLNGYARQTTPELAGLDVLNFPRVRSCGTSTEVSLPCMFSAIGRRDYDQERIRGSESLLHVLDHAGLRVVWLDNQSGCKGVCAGLEAPDPRAAAAPGVCDGQRCFDEVLLNALDRLSAEASGNLVVVLHQLGNHGPAYFRRYPADFERFTPACRTAELSDCSREEIVNAYDNALLYTDHLLAGTVALLKKRQDRYDSAMIYLSDHGESLGEGKLFLHGMPYAIAPDLQTRVPMVMWFSPRYLSSFGLDLACLRRRAAQPASHDNLFHSVLGLLGVNTRAYERGLDLAADCRSGA